MRPRSLVVRLALAAGLLAGASTALATVVVEHSAAARLVDGLDADLHTQQREWEALAAAHPAASADELAALGRRYLGQQHEHPLTQVQLVRISGGAVLSNQPDLAARACAAATRPPSSRGPWLIDAPAGISTALLDAGEQVRVLTLPLAAPGGAGRAAGATSLGTLQIADSMASVRAARAHWWRESLGVGLPLSLAAAVLVALAALVLLRPLRSVGDVAGRVGGGELTARIGRRCGHSSELGRMGAVLDDMFARVEATVARERRFVADASHEMRTPIAVLRAAAERHARQVDPAHRPTADDLVQRVDRLGRLVDDLLTLAVADGATAGQQALARRPQRVGDLGADLRGELPLLGDRRFVVEACEGTIDVDPDRLLQVVRNLVVNAVRHTSPGGQVALRLTPDARPGHLRLTVSDDGAGIDPAVLPHVFERFRSEPGADGRGRRGAAGLGLPICRALVEAHGGTIDVASAPGAGTTVTVVLPGYRP